MEAEASQVGPPGAVRKVWEWRYLSQGWRQQCHLCSVPGPSVLRWAAELSSYGAVSGRAGSDPPSQEPVDATVGHPVRMALLET